MLLATGTWIEFGQFLRIVLWLFLPIFVVSFFLTSWYHYKKRKQKELGDGPSSLPPDKLHSGDYILFDHTDLLRQYRNKLSFSEAKYAALKRDFEQMEKQLKEIKQQNEQLGTSIDAKKEEKAALEQQLMEEKEKLTTNNCFLQNLHKELSAYVNVQEAVSPVVPLHPSYIKSAEEQVNS